MDVVSHQALATLHPTGHHPESPRRLAVVLEAIGSWTEAVPATAEQVERCHTPEHVQRIQGLSGPTWLDGDTPASETSYEAALLAAAARSRRRRPAGSPSSGRRDTTRPPTGR